MNFEFAIIKSNNRTYLCRKYEETYYCVDNPMLSFTLKEKMNLKSSYPTSLIERKYTRTRVAKFVWNLPFTEMVGWLFVL